MQNYEQPLDATGIVTLRCMNDQRADEKQTFKVLLYYKFVPIDDPALLASEQHALCTSLGLRGRILTSKEGINGTVSGVTDACDAYVEAMRADPRFADIAFKVDIESDHVFRKLFVRVKDELVTFRSADAPPVWECTGTHLSAQEWHEMLQRTDVVILDGRTGYEFDIGHFRGAIRPDVDSFREFPEWIEKNLGADRSRPILTYCTGGIRCEKLSGWMLKAGFTNVFQLDGGIVTYGHDPDVQGALWDGKCYVFDERIAVDINHTDDRRVVGRCLHCNAPTERYRNCVNVACNLQHLVCASCEERMDGACSEDCMSAPRRHQPQHPHQHNSAQHS